MITHLHLSCYLVAAAVFTCLMVPIKLVKSALTNFSRVALVFVEYCLQDVVATFKHEFA